MVYFDIRVIGLLVLISLLIITAITIFEERGKEKRLKVVSGRIQAPDGGEWRELTAEEIRDMNVESK